MNNTDDTTEMPAECSRELKASNKKTHNLAATEVKHTIGEVIDCERFSSFRRLVRVTTYVLRAVKMFKSKVDSQSSDSLSVEELSEAERRWIQDSQGHQEREKSFDSLKSQLNLFLDKDGLWRCGGRLGMLMCHTPRRTLSCYLETTVTPLAIYNAHKVMLHNGVRETD